MAGAVDLLRQDAEDLAAAGSMLTPEMWNVVVMAVVELADRIDALERDRQ